MVPMTFSAIKQKHYDKLLRLTRPHTSEFKSIKSPSLTDIMHIEWHIYQENLADTSMLWSEFVDGYQTLTEEMVERIIMDDHRGIVSMASW